MLCRRLQQIEESISKEETVADIGTDHAHLLIALAKDPARIKSLLIGTEVSQGPFARAQENIKRLGLTKRIDLRLGDGLNPISPGEVTSLVVSGMGGRKIIDILAKDIKKTKSFHYLYLQPHRDIFFLRKWLLDNKFSIVQEEITKENSHYYFLLVAIPSEETIEFSDLELHFGRIPLKEKNPLLKDFIEEKIKSCDIICKQLQEKTIKSSNHYAFDNLLKKYCEVLKCL